MKRASMIVIALLSTFLLFSCTFSNKRTLQFATEGPFITAAIAPAGPDDYRNLIKKTIAIEQNGTFTLSPSANKQVKLGENPPTLTGKLTEEEVENIKHLLNEQNVWHLPDDISTESEDGTFLYLSIYLEDEEKQIRGLNPDHEDFLTVHRYLFDLIDDVEYRKWSQEVSEHVWEMNSPDINEKDEYNEDGPFLSILIDNNVEDDLFGDVHFFYTYITLDVHGKLQLSAKDENFERMKDTPRVEETINEKSIAEIQRLLEENIWKFEYYVPGGDGYEQEEITVYLRDEEKTVISEDPTDVRFTEIRDRVLAEIDEETFTDWRKAVQQYINDEVEKLYDF